MVVTFSPHPQKQESIYSLEHRLRILDELGIDVCLVVRFSPSFARMAAQDFIRKILVEKIGCVAIYVGKNFRFGARAAGDFKLLKKKSQGSWCDVRAFDVMKARGMRISSTGIRRLIAAGDLAGARTLLSRRVSVFGTVTEGTGCARRLGYPTANIDPHHEVLPPCGVYAVKVLVCGHQRQGVCYIGSRPTFAVHGSRKGGIHVEVHIFNFRKNIYGRNIEVQFHGKLREQKKFSHPAFLASQINKDIQSAKMYFRLH
jgi:riboflavin kinase/FMN adenylyltransferase